MSKLSDILNNVVEDIKLEISNLPNINVEFTITKKCNMHCSYCFELDHILHQITDDEMKRQLVLLDDLVMNFDTTKYSGIQIVFWGGEPTLSILFVKEIIKHTYKYKFVNYFMYSNGTQFNSFLDLLHDKYFSKILDRFNIQLSYDGEPHNTIKRGNVKDKIFKTYQLLLDNNVTVSLKSTLSYDMIKNLPEIWKSFEKIHDEIDNNIRYCPTLDTMQLAESDDTFEEWKKQLLIIAKYELDFVKKHSYPLMTWFESSDIKLACNISNSINIDVDGNIYICHGCSFSKHKDDFILGNTKNITSIYDILKTYEHGNRSNDCVKCAATFCNICHITTVDSKNFEKDWLTTMSANKNRCRYFQYFGKIKLCLDIAFLKSKYD